MSHMFSTGLGHGAGRSPSLQTVPDPAARARIATRLGRPLALVQDGVTLSSGLSWRLSVGTSAAPAAPDTDLTLFQSGATLSPFSYRGGGQKVTDYFGIPRRQFPVATLADSGTAGNLLDGTGAAVWSVTVTTNSPRIAFRVDGSYTIKSRIRLFLDGVLVDLPEPTAVSPGRRWLVLDMGAGTRKVTLQSHLDTGFLGLSVLPGASLQATPANLRALVVGDSITAAAGPAATWDGFTTSFATLAGIDDLWSSGIGGTGYLATVSGYKTIPQRIAQDVTRALADGPVDLVVLAGGINDIGLGDVTTAATATLDTLALLVPQAVVMVLGPFDKNAPAAPVTGYAAVRDALRAVAARRRGCAFVDLEGLAYEKVDGVHPSAAGGRTLALFLRDQLDKVQCL